MKPKKFIEFQADEPFEAQFKPCEDCDGTGKEQEYTGGPMLPCLNCDGQGILEMTMEEMQQDHEARMEEGYEY